MFNTCLQNEVRISSWVQGRWCRACRVPGMGVVSAWAKELKRAHESLQWWLIQCAWNKNTEGQRLKREDGALDCEGPYLLCQSLVASCRTRGDLERLKPGNEMIRSVFWRENWLVVWWWTFIYKTTELEKLIQSGIFVEEEQIN